MLKGKHILIGVTAGIAAYKTTTLIRLFIKAGASVKVIQTPASVSFIPPLTLSTLSKNPVYSTFENANGDWNNHVELALWADCMVIAPATANTMAKMRHGQCDNLLMACYMSAKCPVYFAPAMDLDMYKHPSVQENISTLQSYGNCLIPATSGELASGLHGEGRMAEPEDIFKHICDGLLTNQALENKKLLITAGPTHEAVDPVRFIGNHSSGKMGVAIAQVAAAKGASVHLVLGPGAKKPENPSIKVYPVVSALDMYKVCTDLFPDVDICICAAAVADYTPETVASEKMKKKDGDLEIKLKRTKDILASLGQMKKDQFLVGFALETNNELAHAKSKLKKKNLDFIVLNSLRDAGAGFQTDTNKICIIDKDNNVTDFELKTKAAVAEDIIQTIIERYIDA